jgi:hypothetical protein
LCNATGRIIISINARKSPAALPLATHNTEKASACVSDIRGFIGHMRAMDAVFELMRFARREERQNLRGIYKKKLCKQGYSQQIAANHARTGYIDSLLY